jgi:FMN phosphatase YigB (HAD superfamily)
MPDGRAGLPNPVAPDTRIRAVLFDLDGTLYDQRPVRRRMFIELAAHALARPWRGMRIVQALSAYRRGQETLRGQDADTPVAAAQLALASKASGLDAAAVAALVDEWMIERPLRHVARYRAAGLVALLDTIEAAGVRAGLLSDYPASRKLAALGVARRFSPVICTSDPDVNALKPHPRGFERACEAWGLPASEVLMVGDRIEVDGAGAAAAGLPAIVIGRSSRPAGPGCARLPSLEALHRVFLTR